MPCRTRTAPAPLPPFDHLAAFARPLSIAVCRHAVADYQSARDRLKEGRRRHEAFLGVERDLPPEEAAEWEMWLKALTSFALDAERRLCGVILMGNRRIEHPDDHQDLPPGWQPCALGMPGPVFVVIPRGDDDPRPRLIEVECESFDSPDFGAGAYDDDLADEV